MPRPYPTGCPSTAGSAFTTPAGEEVSAGRSIRPAAPMAASTFRLRRLRRSLKTSPREIRCSATTWPVQSPKKRLRRKNRQQPLRPPQPLLRLHRRSQPHRHRSRPSRRQSSRWVPAWSFQRGIRMVREAERLRRNPVPRKLQRLRWKRLRLCQALWVRL